MPKTPVSASIAASTPMAPSAIVAARAGNSGPASASHQPRTMMGAFGSMAFKARSIAGTISFAGRYDRTAKTVLACSFCDSGK